MLWPKLGVASCETGTKLLFSSATKLYNRSRTMRQETLEASSSLTSLVKSWYNLLSVRNIGPLNADM